MASLLITPDIVEFVDHITLEGTKQINILEIYTDRSYSFYRKKKSRKFANFPQNRM